MSMLKKILISLGVSMNIRDNPIQDYNPDYALELLEEAGWTKKKETHG